MTSLLFIRTNHITTMHGTPIAYRYSATVHSRSDQNVDVETITTLFYSHLAEQAPAVTGFITGCFENPNKDGRYAFNFVMKAKNLTSCMQLSQVVGKIILDLKNATVEYSEIIDLPEFSALQAKYTACPVQLQPEIVTVLIQDAFWLRRDRVALHLPAGDHKALNYHVALHLPAGDYKALNYHDSLYIATPFGSEERVDRFWSAADYERRSEPRWHAKIVKHDTDTFRKFWKMEIVKNVLRKWVHKMMHELYKPGGALTLTDFSCRLPFVAQQRLYTVP